MAMGNVMCAGFYKSNRREREYHMYKMEMRLEEIRALHGQIPDSDLPGFVGERGDCDS